MAVYVSLDIYVYGHGFRYSCNFTSSLRADEHLVRVVNPLV